MALSRHSLSLTIVVALSFFASAVAEEIDLGQIELGKEYPLTAYNTYTGYVVPDNGTMIVTGVQAMTLTSGGATIYPENLSPQRWAYQVAAGYDYHFDYFAWDSGVMKFEMQGASGPDLGITSIYPAPGGYLSATCNSGSGELVMHANFTGIWSSCWIVWGDKSSSTYMPPEGMGMLSVMGVPVMGAMRELYDQGLQENDAIQVCVSGLRDRKGNLYNGDGLMEIDYKACSEPLSLVATDLAEYQDIYSAYPEDAKDAVFRFEFSGSVDAEHVFSQEVAGELEEYRGPVVSLGCVGNQDAWFYIIPTTVEDNTVIVNLRGWDFGNFHGVLSASALPEFKLLNIYGLDGQMAYGNGTENGGSYSFPINYLADDIATGIGGLQEESGQYNVYNLQGLPVLTEGKACELRNLPAGIYIVNSQLMTLPHR